ncbi:hypothetical protein CRI94_00630 [Longibacter salinarum]|uniref:UspA domain-containing protein n=1 Tax=Longibacter salinarum TaxID=1850348 RepID=A0A2A8D1P9_9BACT|nr:universal stress protein [Longibacter salinarum]PEN14836.1 hypothetical protein CRI94_00630 [Longibacter salinarum]
MTQLNSILAATDLSVGCDAVLHSAAQLAENTGAELHIVHVASEWDRHAVEPSEALDAQVRRVLPYGGAQSVEVRHDRAFHGILVHAAHVHADLVVIGNTRMSSIAARLQATTAERIVRSAEVPCLVVRSPFIWPVEQFGVAVDGTVADQGLVHLLSDWIPRFGGAPQVTFVNVHGHSEGDGLTPVDVSARRAEQVFPSEVDVSVIDVNSADPVSGLTEWARGSTVQWLVVATAARQGIDRLWNGSRAARLIQEAPCSVLLVPSTYWRRSPIHLDRIAVAVSAEEQGGAPRRWIDDRIARAQTPIQAVAIDASESVVDAAWDARADLIVVSDDRLPGDTRSPVNPELVQVLEQTYVPVLVLRDLPEGPIERILVAVDTGELWYEKFGWARRLHERFGTKVTVLHAIDLSLRSKVRRTPGGEFVTGLSTWMNDDIERTVLPAMRAWLWERVRLAGLPEDAVDVEVTMTDPWYAIPTFAESIGADLVVAAAHSRPGPDPAPLSPITRAVLMGGTYSVLAVVDRERAVARSLRDQKKRTAKV